MLRNREIRQFTLLFTGITIITAILGFTIQPVAGLLILSTCATFGTLFFLFTKAHYQRITQISEQINLVLHNTDHLFISNAEEGELSILQNEITKMTLRIREQNEALKKEKIYLADSLADIAHQLRTPLTSANLIVSLLKNNPEEHERKTLLWDIQKLFVQMDWLLTSLLKLSRLDADIVNFKMKPLDVTTLIKDSLHPFLMSMDLHNITPQVNIADRLVIHGDFGWLSEAIQNILKNCIESIGNNGTIQIVCQENILYTEITLHDSGPGFKKEDVPYLFERFYRGKNTSTTGYGIGLALCKTIITRQGGTISAKNHPQGGAIFSIRFPK